jgi:integrase
MEELQEAGNSGATCNRKLSALSMMLKRAEDFGSLPSVPRMKLYKESKHRVCWFSDTDEQAMLAACDRLGLPELHDFITIGLDTGFRFSELLCLTTNDYHKGTLILHAGETKGGNARAVPCSTRVKAIIAKRQQEIAYRLFPTLTAGTCRTQWEAVRAALGRQEDPAFIIHVMRHTCATRLVGEGVPLNVVQAWMGHAAITTTMRYAHLSGAQMVAAGVIMDERRVNVEV